MSEAKLKLCPFCGGTATLHSPEKFKTRSGYLMSYVYCDKCYAESPQISCTKGIIEDTFTPILKSRQEQDLEAILKWNKRVSK